MDRVALGFLVTALALPVLVLLGGNLFGALYVALFTGGIAFFFGLPLFLWFRRRRWLAFWQCILAGALAGLPAALPFAGIAVSYGGGLRALMDMLPLLRLLAVFGGVHGAVFWLVAIAGNAEFAGSPGAHDHAGDSARRCRCLS